MSYFPLFIDLKGQHCLVIGGGKVALRKVRSLLSFGALITVIAPVIRKEISEIKVIEKRIPFQEKEVDGAYLVIAATNDAVVNRQVVSVCKKKGILVSSITDGEGTFLYPGIVRRGDIIIGVTTEGKCPALTKHIVDKISKAIGEDYAEILSNLEQVRKEIKERVEDQAMRQKILYELLHQAVDGKILTSEVVNKVIEDQRK